MAGGLFDPSLLYETLRTYGMLPKWSKQTIPGSDEYGAFYPEFNKMMAPPVYSPLDKGTVSHEMTHGVQINLLAPAAQAIAQKQREGKEKLTREEASFLDAFQKIMNTHVGTVGQYNPKDAMLREEQQKRMLTSLYKKDPKKFDDFDKYRTSPKELQAFGIGKFTKGAQTPQEFANTPLHLDSSMATEFSILMDMFNRLPESLRTQATQTQKAYIENKRVNKFPETYLNRYQFEDMLADPFKPTIK